ncbi:MAG: hypothetical protein M3198_16005 [Actinomycetota bacterium]|nr:hypothetical protein [Actinomycetota bacterium]
MAVNRGARIALSLGILVALLGYALVVEFGVNAGRIHYGVEIRGDLAVGGMTPAEADDVLKERAQLMLEDEIILGGQGVEVRFYPQAPELSTDDVLAAGWAPGRAATIEAALAVGRDEGPFNAIAERWNAWMGGVKVGWKGHARAFRVTKIIDEVERLGQKRGLTVDRPALRLKIRRALNSWPRRPFYRIPFSD